MEVVLQSFSSNDDSSYRREENSMRKTRKDFEEMAKKNSELEEFGLYDIED